MEEFLGDYKRTVYCGDVTEKQIGETMTVMGWVAKQRNLGSLIFADLRDRSGIIQLVFDSTVLDAESYAKAETIRTEFVVAAVGKLRMRESVNDKIKTGRVELLVDEFKILSQAETTPFFIGDASANVNEALKLKYRYLDLRNPSLQSRLITRSKVTKAIRDYLTECGFLEIETPFLGRSTPEGARDYLVPSRVHPGNFYALPQSPQLYKQLLMISGFDRYFQIARCFRDEDLRANRQPEFTQVDLEMSFVDSERDVMNVAEGMIKKIFSEFRGLELNYDFPVMTYAEAMNRFGSDKPDTRFGLEINNITDLVEGCEFKAFAENCSKGRSVRAVNAEGFASLLSRKEIDKLTELAKTYKAKGLAYGIMKEDGFNCSFAKFLTEKQIDNILKRMNVKVGDVLFVCADTDEIVFAALGALRLALAEKGKLIDKNRFDFLWVIDFPMFEWDEEQNRFMAKHHPFTSPKIEDVPLIATDPGAVRAKAYDLVINGEEAGGGSIRIHSKELQKTVFNALGFSDKDIIERFGFFVEAFNYGTPPHGGLAFGLDRLIMQLTDTDNIKDVIAFPKVQNASDLMTDAPNTVEDKQLTDLQLSIKDGNS